MTGHKMSSSGSSRIQLEQSFINDGFSLLLKLQLTLLICAQLASGSPAYVAAVPATAAPTSALAVDATKTAAAAAAVTRVQQCREGCYEKFSTKEAFCQQNSECLTCWDECAKPPPPKINKTIRETWSLYTVAMLQQDSLVLVDVAWSPLSTPNQCLVTWEVAGGGLMGNLLTESFNVQLSLWPDTKYKVQVTCKNKLTGTMSRSLPLTIDTADATIYQLDSHIGKHPHTTTTTTSTTSTTSSTTTTSKAFTSATEQNAMRGKLMLPRDDIINDIANSLDEVNHEDNSNGNNMIDALVDVDSDDDGDADVIASIESQDIAAVLPYDDQSSETLNQHTNFVFNWHTRHGSNGGGSDNSHANINNLNEDISAIEPLKHNFNLLTLTTISDMQKPLLFGVIAGTLLLALILLMYVCMLRTQRLTSADKAALMADTEAHGIVVSMPPVANGHGDVVGLHAGVANVAYESHASSDVCKNPAICSCNTIKV